MLLQIVNVIYVLVAIAMIGLILMQRGAGAQAGSGFGGGASATVFGSRGASSFLTKSTRWLAIAFFVISMGMAVYASRAARQGEGPVQADLGVMAQAANKAKAPAAQVPASQPQAAPAAQPAATVPAAPPQQEGADAPAASAAAEPAPGTPKPEATPQPAPTQ